MSKDYYISKIIQMSDYCGDKLLDLMNTYNRGNLKEITLDEAKEYYLNMLQLSSV